MNQDKIDFCESVTRHKISEWKAPIPLTMCRVVLVGGSEFWSAAHWRSLAATYCEIEVCLRSLMTYDVFSSIHKRREVGNYRALIIYVPELLRFIISRVAVYVYSIMEFLFTTSGKSGLFCSLSTRVVTCCRITKFRRTRSTFKCFSYAIVRWCSVRVLSTVLAGRLVLRTASTWYRSMHESRQ